MPTAVVALDFATHAHEIAHRAAPLLGAMGARVVLLYQVDVAQPISPSTVIHPSEAPGGIAVGDYLEADARAQMQRVVDLLRDDGLSVELRVGRGPVVPGIVTCTEEVMADLLVIGCDLRAGLSRLFSGSFTEAVLRAATCPVLVIRARGEASGPSQAREQVNAEVDG